MPCGGNPPAEKGKPAFRRVSFDDVLLPSYLLIAHRWQAGAASVGHFGRHAHRLVRCGVERGLMTYRDLNSDSIMFCGQLV